MKNFKSLIELITFFNTEEKCLEYIAQERWGDTPFCPHCGSTDKVYKFSDGKRFKCSSCLKQFTAKIGTMFQDSKIPLAKWFAAIYLLTSHKKGISSHQLARDLGLTQKTAWHLLHRIRSGFNIDTPAIDEYDTVLLDETFVGGKNKNRHKDKKVENSQGRSFKDKTPILGVLVPNKTVEVTRPNKNDPSKNVTEKIVITPSFVKCYVVPDTKGKNLQPIIRSLVPHGATIVSDEWHAYRGLGNNYDHRVIDHGRKEYVNEAGDTTNALESFWGWIKRAYTGVYHYMSRKHLQFYADEAAFRFNTRLQNGAERFALLIASTNRKLSYKTLIGR